MERAILLSGGNQGNRQAYLSHALFFLEQKAGNVVAPSAVYETEPWGFEDPVSFLNQAVLLETSLGPAALLEEIQTIEWQLGRQHRRQHYSSRTIDIDILFYGDKVVSEPSLVIPHPRLTERLFALVPVNEICPDWMHPILKIPVSTLLARCNDRHQVKKLP